MQYEEPRMEIIEIEEEPATTDLLQMSGGSNDPDKPGTWGKPF